MMTAAVVAGAAVVALVVGLFAGRALQRRRQGLAANSADGVVSEARRRAHDILSRADEEGRAKAQAYREREEAGLEHRRLEIGVHEQRIEQREATLEQRAANLAQRETLLLQRERDAGDARLEAERLREQARLELEQVAGFDARAAKEQLLRRVEDEGRRDAMVLLRDLEVKAREEADRRARRILTSSIQRLASEVVTETTVSVVPLPSDDMKGRIIGRDGRNIRAFEAVTGVNIIVDDTPEAVALSAFDPVRREVARLALERLIADGRIHPASIEDAYEKAMAEVEQSVRDAGEWAMLEVGITRMHPELVNLLGRLKYRLSYGQNVLHHLVETAKVAGMLASEIGVRSGPGPARRLPARHRQGGQPRTGRVARHGRRRDRPPLRGGPGRGARHRGASQRGRAAHPGCGHRAGRRQRVGRPARERGGRRWSPMCTASSRSSRSPGPSRASTGSSPCRPGARSGWWSTPGRSTTWAPATWRGASRAAWRRTCSTPGRSR